MNKIQEGIWIGFVGICLTCTVWSCIIGPGKFPQIPTPTPTPLPRFTDIPPFITPTAKSPVPFSARIPVSIPHDVQFKIIATSEEETPISVWVDKKWCLGDMRWDSEKKVKYLNVHLNSVGMREIEFKIDGTYSYSQTIEVLP